MKNFQDNFMLNVDRHPDNIALANARQSISYSSLADEINHIRVFFKEHNIKRAALALSNSPAWVAFDLAAMFENIPLVPIPHFFSTQQVQHLITNAGVDTIISTIAKNEYADLAGITISGTSHISVFDQNHALIKINSSQQQNDLPPDTLKVSYTSGTTGEPKGVIISALHVDKVVTSLKDTLHANSQDRHLSVLPFSLLLENIAGVYTVLAAGGQCLVPDFLELGLSGSSSMNISTFINAIRSYQPTTMITVPALAQALVAGSKKLGIRHDSLRFIAVGGAPLSESVIKQAHQLGLPLFEGYGLTECSSVVALNSPDQYKTGSVGMPLSHTQIEISGEGEIMAGGALCTGYLDNIQAGQTTKWATGDLGYLDEDGFLFITGRKRTTYCTAYGRNVSPEWIERELVTIPFIQQAIIYGEGKPFNLAIIVPREADKDPEIEAAINQLNHKLPDYARISRWITAAEPYSINNRQLSASGILQRHQILTDYNEQITSIYQ